MSSLVLALGTFLSLSGAFAIYAGYGIIAVERGWAMFIAGSTAFSCGIVTLALGLILRRLASLHAFLLSADAMAVLREPSQGGLLEPSILPDAEPSLAPTASLASATSPRARPQRPARSHLAAARSFLTARGRGLPKTRGPDESDHLSQKSPSLSSDAWDPAPAGTHAPLDPGFDLPAEVPAARAAGEAEQRPVFSSQDEPPFEFAWRTEPEDHFWNADRKADFFDEDHPDGSPAGEPRQSQHETSGQDMAGQDMAGQDMAGQDTAGQDTAGQDTAQPEPNTSWPVETASIEAIIEEQLIIELNRVPDALSEGLGPALSPKTPGQDNRDLAPPHEHETTAGTGPETEPPPAEPGQGEFAIVGQYESAGTSYVMYSDGSIEARNANAVFHFKSMAELKAFLESGAQNPQG